MVQSFLGHLGLKCGHFFGCCFPRTCLSHRVETYGHVAFPLGVAEKRRCDPPEVVVVERGGADLTKPLLCENSGEGADGTVECSCESIQTAPEVPNIPVAEPRLLFLS